MLEFAGSYAGSEEMMSRRDADFATINIRLAQIQSEIKSFEYQREETAVSGQRT